VSAKSANCHLICGEDDFQVALEARELIERLVPAENRMFGLEIIDGRVDNRDESLACLAKCQEALLMDGLFGSEKLVWLREPSFLANDRLARLEAIKAPLTALTTLIKAGLPEGQHLMLTTSRIHRASALFKAFGTAGEVKDFGNNLKERECKQRAQQFLDRWLPTLELTMDEPVRQQFLARAGYDSRQIAAELDKLRCYRGAAGKVAPADIEAIVSGGGVNEIWNFIDAFGRRDLADLLRQLRQLLAQSEHPIRLANSLESRINDLLPIREALDRQWAMPDSYAGLRWNSLPTEIDAWLTARDPDFRKMHAFRLKNLVAQAAGWTVRDLRVARHHLVQMRENLVSSSLPQEWLLEVCLIEALGGARKARRPQAATG
jgi:DNA polymerase III delta subunit